MSRTVVISQPMYFPWVGMLEQIRLCDVYIHLDDAQFSKGSFTNRVQVKTADGFRWMTVPVGVKLGQEIREVPVGPREQWQPAHRALLESAYEQAPGRATMLDLLGSAHAHGGATIDAVARASMDVLVDFFGLRAGREFLVASQLGVGGRSSERVLALVQRAGGDVYVTGHGARNYLDHELFERAGVEVRYIQYERIPYPQLHGAFNPHVSALDLAANLGRAGERVIRSGSVNWKEFVTA